MAERSAIYLRPGFSDLQPIPLEIRKLLFVSSEQLTELANSLTGIDGFLSSSSLTEIVRTTLKELDAQITDSIVEVIESIEIATQDSDPVPIDIEKLAKFLCHTGNLPAERKPNQLSEEDYEEIKAKIKILNIRCPARLGQNKAEKLSDSIGLRLEDFEMICDMRPVFDENQQRIAGVIPFTTLKITAYGIDRFPRYFEVVVSLRDLQEIERKARVASSKLKAVIDLAKNHTPELLVPITELTEAAGDRT